MYNDDYDDDDGDEPDLQIFQLPVFSPLVLCIICKLGQKIILIIIIIGIKQFKDAKLLAGQQCQLCLADADKPLLTVLSQQAMAWVMVYRGNSSGATE